MNIDLTRLNNNIEKEIVVDEKFEVTKDKLLNTDLIDLKDVLVKGVITKDDIDYNLNFNINGMMILKCSVTLEAVKHPFNINVNGKLAEIIEEISGNLQKNENTIDIFPIIWENILVEIPMKVVSDKAKNFKAEGDGWKLITELEAKEEVNPELEKLKELL